MAVGLHIYAITGSTFAVSLVGAFALLPMIVFGLHGGMLDDAFDRRLVLLVAAVVAWGSTITLAALAWTGVHTVWPFYLLTTVNAVAATVIGTVRSAVLPRLLPARLLPAASALSGMSLGVMATVGPALAGVLVATAGFGWTYTVDVALFLSAFLGIVALPASLQRARCTARPVSALFRNPCIPGQHAAQLRTRPRVAEICMDFVRRNGRQRPGLAQRGVSRA